MRFFSFLFLFIFLISNAHAAPTSYAKTNNDLFTDAEKLIEIDQTKEALAILRTIVPENDKQTAEQYYLLARLYYLIGKFSKANDFYRDASLLYPGEPKYQVGLSQTSYALGKLKLAERYANLALKYNPDLRLEISSIISLEFPQFCKTNFPVIS